MLTQKELHEVLNYSSDTGVFTWKASNRIAGCTNAFGYIQVRICGVDYKAHRLAWMYIYGAWPENDIDHINHYKSDNRIDNLRDVTKSVNMQNRVIAHCNNSTGLLGVSFHKGHGKFYSRIKLNGKTVHLGYFQSAELAHIGYMNAKRTIHKPALRSPA